MRRLAPLMLSLALTACAVEPAGPVSPIAQEQVTPGPALEVSAARLAVVRFVHAYAGSAQEGVGPLSRLVAGAELASWVRWLGVQHREFAGAIRATAEIRDVEFIGTVETDRTTGAQVGLSASVTFDFEPDGGDPFRRARILDGPVTLIRTADGTYRVLDLLRDGMSMSDGIQLFREEARTRGDLTVTLDSLFLFPPSWQFNVVVENRGGVDGFLDVDGAALFVRREGQFERVDGVVTDSLATVPPGGAVDGILAYPSQEAAEGRVLSIAYRVAGRVHAFEFPLDDLISAVPPLPPTGEAPVVEAAG